MQPTNAVGLVFRYQLMTLKNMVMATATKYKSRGAQIALARARRAYEIMQAFKRASINPKVK